VANLDLLIPFELNRINPLVEARIPYVHTDWKGVTVAAVAKAVLHEIISPRRN